MRNLILTQKLAALPTADQLLDSKYGCPGEASRAAFDAESEQWYNSTLIKQAFANIPEQVRQQVNLSYDIADRIAVAMEKQHISRHDLAVMTDATEEDVASWIGGGHNFDLTTLSLLSTAIGSPLVSVPSI